MEVTVFTHPEFERQFKKYNKKYHSLVSDFRMFLESIKRNPFQGNALRKGIRKVRLRVSAKGKGKSGGMRIITYSVNKLNDSKVEITLLYIYDKKEMGNVSDSFLSYLLEQV